MIFRRNSTHKTSGKQHDYVKLIVPQEKNGTKNGLIENQVYSEVLKVMNSTQWDRAKNNKLNHVRPP